MQREHYCGLTCHEKIFKKGRFLFYRPLYGSSGSELAKTMHGSNMRLSADFLIRRPPRG